MTKKMTNILVGCGGSGAKIATELAELMGQDPQWRNEMDKNVFFMLIDTDQNDLDRYSSRLGRSAPNVHVSTILSTAGFNTVGEILAEFLPGLMDGTDEENKLAMERFAEHWWFENPDALNYSSGNAFRARSVSQIKTGAGQVPLVSHLAAWHAMRGNARTPTSIEATLSNLCDVIAGRRAIINHDGGNPLETFNIFFLGSVAGGTGRGCMIPVAFKFKEVFFNRFNSVPFISGYFLDESCFKQGRDQHEEWPQRLNAMTGWSEISSWLSLFKGSDNREGGEYGFKGYSYSLPGTRGTSNPSYDVLRSPLEGRPATDGTSREQDVSRMDRARLPFDAVGVIGNTSSSGFAIRDPQAIYQMVATGLYCRLTRSEIDSKISNDGRTYFSIGSAVAEIPCHDIQTYYSDLAQHDVAHSMIRTPSAGEAHNHSNEIVEWLGLDDPLPTLLAEPVEGEVKSSTQLLLRDWFSEQGDGTLELNMLRQALDDQSLSDVENVLDEMLSESRLEDPFFLDQIGRAFVEQLVNFHRSRGLELGEGDCEAIAQAVEELLIAEQPLGDSGLVSTLNRSGSVVVVAETARAVRMMLEEISDSTLSQKSVQSWFSDPLCPQRQPDVAVVFEEIKGREGPLGLTGKFFNDQEISRLISEAQLALQVLYARALGKWLSSVGGATGKQGLLGHMRLRLKRIQDNADMVEACANRYLSESSVTAEILRQRAAKLFARKDQLVEALAMSDLNSTNYYVRRSIRPLEPEATNLKLVNPMALEIARSALVGPSLEGSPEDQPVLRDSLRESFSAAKYLFKDQNDGEQIISRFELSPVLRDLRKAWMPYLEGVKNKGRDPFEEVAQKFLNFFGIKPKLINDNVSISSDGNFESISGEDSLLLGMACAMARSCRPFWRTTSSSGRQPKLLVQIPIDPVQEKISSWQQTIMDQANIQGASGNAVQVVANKSDPLTSDRHNPFVLVVYMSEGSSTLDQVESLDAWQTDSKVHKALERAEDLRKPPMPFASDTEMWDGYRGSGFADPCYVFNPLLRKHRWRPWISLEKQERESAEISELDLAVVYACWGPEWLLNAIMSQDQSTTVLQGSNLPSGPILLEGNRQIFSYARHPCIIEDSGGATVNTARLMFAPGDAFAQSIRTVPDVLKGREKPRSKAQSAETAIPALREAIEREYAGFFENLAKEHGFHPMTGRALYVKLLDAMKARAIEERDENPQNGDFWQSVVEAINVKRKLHDG